MIVTVTLNPSLDRTIEVDVLTRGAVIRARSARLDPGGKGVNVSRALLANGVASTAVVAVGGGDGDQLHRLLAAEGMRVRAVRVAGRLDDGALLASARDAYVQGMDAVFAACGAGSLAAAVLLWLFMPRRGREDAAPAADARQSDHEPVVP